MHSPKIGVPTKRPATNILQATSKLMGSSLDESVTFSNLSGTKLKIRVSIVVGHCDNEVGLIALQVQGENFLSKFRFVALPSVFVRGKCSLGVIRALVR